MDEIEKHGGMSKAIEVGLPKLRIEEAAASKQARIDRGVDRIIGVNIFQVDEVDDDDLDLLNVDAGAVRIQQTDMLEELRSKRDGAKVDLALSNLEKGAIDPYVCAGFPLERAVEAMDMLTQRKVVGKVVVTMNQYTI